MNGRQVTAGGVLALVFAFTLSTSAAAQRADYFGLVTPLLGVTAGGDAQDTALTPGLSVAVFDTGGWGAEADIAYARGFDATRFDESSASTFMLNAIWTSQRGRIRPFGAGGVGLIRTRVCAGGCVASTTHVDVGMNVGAGLQVPVGEFFFLRGDVRYFRALQEHADLGLASGGALRFWRAAVGFSVWFPVL